MKTKEIIDAVADGINALALPNHRTFKYHRPISLSGGPRTSMSAALAVAPAVDRAPILATNGDNAWSHRILITWYAGQLQQAGQARLDEKLTGDTLDVVSLIAHLLASWETGVEGLDFQSQATMGEVHYGALEGGIYAAEINIQIDHWTED